MINKIHLHAKEKIVFYRTYAISMRREACDALSFATKRIKYSTKYFENAVRFVVRVSIFANLKLQTQNVSAHLSFDMFSHYLFFVEFAFN